MNKNMKKIVSKVTAGVLTVAVSFSLLSNLPAAMITVNADSGISINKTNFPDEIFRNYVSQKCDSDTNGFLSNAEISKVTKISVEHIGVSDLTGIEYFTALEELYCFSNKLTSINVKNNTALKKLSCFDNQITSLDVSKNTALEILSCFSNKLTSLNVSQNTALISLWCNQNQITSLDVSKNTALTYLNCGNNKLSSLDVSKNKVLTYLNCFENSIKYLDVRNNPALAMLCCFNNQIAMIDISNNSILLDLYAAGENTSVSIEGVPDNVALYFDGITENTFAIDRSVSVFTTPVKAGWNKCGGYWFYFKDTNNIVTGWQQIGGCWYYFNDGGVMQTGWRKINNVQYFFKSGGEMAAEEYCEGYWLDKSGAWTYQAKASWKADSKGWYYQDTKGWYPRNQWLKIDGQWYFFKPDGYLASSEYWNGYWFNSNGTWTYQYKASWRQDSTGWWYGDASGWYAKNQSLKINGKLYNFNASGYCTNP